MNSERQTTKPQQHQPAPAGGLLQRAAVTPAAPELAPPIVHDVLRTPGQPLDATTRAFMEPRFGRDFGDVRVHADAQAADSARAVNALAYTVGSDVVFGAGQHQPQSEAGKRLIAHELTHVVQQEGATLASSFSVAMPDNLCEQEARLLMDCLSSDSFVGVTNLNSDAMVQRQVNKTEQFQSGSSSNLGSQSVQERQTGFVAWYNFIRERLKALKNPSMSPSIILIEERTLQRMNRILEKSPNIADREIPLLAYHRIQRQVMTEIERDPKSAQHIEKPAPPESDEFNRRLDPYQFLAEQLFSYRSRSTRLVHEPWEQKVWLVRENSAVQDVLNIIGQRLMKWALEHIDIANQRVPQIVLAEIAESPEIQAMFYAAQLLKLDAESFSTAADVPLWQKAARIIWGFIPIIGDVTDLTEALSGWDILEQRKLSAAERTIMLIGALLPLVPGSALRSGKEGVTETAKRLARRAPGHGASDFEYALKLGDTIAPQADKVRAAIQKIRQGKQLTTEELKNLEGIAKKVVSTNSPPAAKLQGKVVQAGTKAGIQATRTVHRLNLPTIPKITASERSVLDKLAEDAWDRVWKYAQSNKNRFSIKGKIAEELIIHTPEFSNIMQRALKRAARENIPSTTVQFVQNIRGLAPTATSAGKFAELADGAIIAIQGNKVRILAIFESKSPSNLRELARRPGEVLGQLGWDFERFRELPIIINGRTFQPEDVIISRHATDWLGVAPPGFLLNSKQLEAIRRGLPGFQLFQGLVQDSVLNDIAARILSLL